MPSMSVSERSGSATMSAADSGRSWMRAGRVAIGADPKRIGPLELQQVGDVLENGGDFVIGHGRDEG